MCQDAFIEFQTPSLGECEPSSPHVAMLMACPRPSPPTRTCSYSDSVFSFVCGCVVTETMSCLPKQDNAEAAVRQMLVDFSLQMGLGEVTEERTQMVLFFVVVVVVVVVVFRKFVAVLTLFAI